MTQTNFELVRLKLAGNQLFLLWEGGKEEPDHYLTLPGSKKLVVSQKEDEIRRIASTLGGNLVASSAMTEFDLASFWRALGQLRPLRSVSSAHCTLILDTWNLFEDIARSMGLSFSAVTSKSKYSNQKIYKKFFYGNNLPSMTPAGKSYSPAFNSEELKAIRRWFRHAWKEITDASPFFMHLTPKQASSS